MQPTFKTTQNSQKEELAWFDSWLPVTQTSIVWRLPCESSYLIIFTIFSSIFYFAKSCDMRGVGSLLAQVKYFMLRISGV